MGWYAKVVMSLVIGMAQFAHAQSDVGSIRRKMASLGVTAQTLALVGCNASQARDMATSLGEQDEGFAAWDGIAAEVSRLSAELCPLLEAARLHPLDEGARSAYAIKRHELAAARLRLAKARDDVFDALVAGLTAQQVAGLEQCRLRMHSGTPPEFWVVDCSVAGWREIQLAFTAEQRATRRRETLSSEHADVLEAVREQAKVREAARLLSLNRDALQQALDDGMRAGLGG